jgi:YegS/Rv2252/BmrU family lipid kinase
MSSANKTFVVVNPTAGGGLGRRLWPQVAQDLKKKIGPFDFEETTSNGHGRFLAAEAAHAGYSLLIAFGGDGTIHEVANGIYEAASQRRPTLGILCVGTGGDLIKTLNIPKNLSDQIGIVSGKKTRLIDLGRVDYANKGKKESRIFINVANAGLGAEVVRRVHSSRKLFGRKLAYLSATFSSYLSWHPRKIALANNHQEMRADWPKKMYSVVIANGRFFGGGMPIAPSADPSDGLFDLIVIGELNPLLGGLAIPLLYSKQLHHLPNVRTDRVKRISLSSDEPVDLDIDGESIGSLPATFEIIPKALEIKVP